MRRQQRHAVAAEWVDEKILDAVVRSHHDPSGSEQPRSLTLNGPKNRGTSNLSHFRINLSVSGGSLRGRTEPRARHPGDVRGQRRATRGVAPPRTRLKNAALRYQAEG